MAFMGAAELRKDKFGLLLDMVYADLSTDGEWVQDRVEDLDRHQLGMYTLAAAYRVYDADRSFVDLYAGARFFDTKLTSASPPTAAAASGRRASTGPTRSSASAARMPLTERWSVSGFADVGGFDGSSRPELGALRRGELRLHRAWAGTLGYRYMSILYQATDRAKLDIDIQGPVLGDHLQVLTMTRRRSPPIAGPPTTLTCRGPSPRSAPRSTPAICR